MNKLNLFLLLFAILPAGLFGQVNSKAIDDRFGFRDIKLETPLTKFKNLVKLMNRGETSLYRKKDEDLKIGDFRLKDVTYVFYDSILSSIIIRTEGISNSHGVLKVLQQAYGNGYKENEYIENYVWEGDHVVITYKESIGNDGSILIQSKKMMDLLLSAQEKRNRSAAQTTF